MISYQSTPIWSYSVTYRVSRCLFRDLSRISAFILGIGKRSWPALYTYGWISSQIRSYRLLINVLAHIGPYSIGGVEGMRRCVHLQVVKPGYLLELLVCQAWSVVASWVHRLEISR